MAIYTVSLNFLENLEPSEMSYVACILYCFVNDQHPDKLAVDNNKYILNKYMEVTSAHYADIIKHWVDMLSYIPGSIEKIDVDLTGITDNEDICLALCSKTKGGKKLIVHSLNLLKCPIDESNHAVYDGCSIEILDKDEAKIALNPHSVLNITKSIVAGGDANGAANTCDNGKR